MVGITLLFQIVFIPKSDSVSILQGSLSDSRRQLYDETCKAFYNSARGRNGKVSEKCKELQFSISAVMNSGALGKFIEIPVIPID